MRGNTCLMSSTKQCTYAGDRAVEALKEMDDQIIPWFQSAAAELLKDMPAEKALALALAKITGNTELKVSYYAIETNAHTQMVIQTIQTMVRQTSQTMVMLIQHR